MTNRRDRRIADTEAAARAYLRLITGQLDRSDRIAAAEGAAPRWVPFTTDAVYGSELGGPR